MTEMVERTARAIAVQHGTDPDGRSRQRRFIEKNAEGVDQIITDHMGPLWTLWKADARAALLAALDLTPAERDAIAEALRGTEVRTGGFAFYQDTVDAVLVALKKRAQGERQ